MKTIVINKKMLVALTALTLFGVGNSEANSSFSSQAALGMSLGTLPSDLLINGSFQQALADNGMISGDGSVAAIFPAGLPTVTGGNYVFDLFSVSGHATNGEVAGSSYTGWYNLGFTNQSLSAMSVSLTLNYALAAAASGQFADTNVSLDYYMNNDPSVNVFLNASVFGQANAANNDAKVITFNLDPGSTQTFHSDVTINGNVSASPVPLPAAVWLFLTGLLVMLRGTANYAKNRTF
jgi:hypothetical protein